MATFRMTLLPTPRRHLWVWFLWLACFYAVWAWLLWGHDRWGEVVTHWPIAVAMTFGSYIAGSTPMGGGTVGFPILVLLFEMPATLGRDFSFAVQSIGMTSASIFILARRQPLAWATLKGSMVGAVIGLPIGLAFVAPAAPDLVIKLVFAIIWASFGVLHLYRLREIAGNEGMTDFGERWDFRVGFFSGVIAAATAASVTGVGIDMMVYAVLVLLCRADLKIAIPTSVIIMAFTSLLGVLLKTVTTGMQPGVFENWLAAAPIVALGAPLGVFVVSLLGRKPTLLVVALLCVGQFVWTCHSERDVLGWGGVAMATVAVGAGVLILEILRSAGRRIIRAPGAE